MIISILVFPSSPDRDPHLLTPQLSVITGYNTDIEFNGVTYHIQTEDKGLATPIIMSLVYDRGTILASRRQPYDDLITAGFDEKALAQRLQKQHKTICAAIKKGKIEQLRGMSAESSPRPAKKGSGKTAGSKKAAHAASGNGKKDDPLGIDLLDVSPIDADIIDDAIAPIPMPKLGFSKPVPKPAVQPLVDMAVPFLEVPQVVPVDAVRVVSDLAGVERPDSNKLSLELLSGDTFRGGTNCTVTVMVSQGSKRRVIDGAEVMIKVLGSSFRPLIYHSRTDKNGISNVTLQLPTFTSGRASVLVRAISHGEEVEVRRPVAHS